MMVAMVKDEWVRAAMMDDSVVVELLVRLKKQTNHVVKSEAEAAAAPLRWGIRQRRSRSSRCDAVSMRRKDAADSANNSMRASPTTPLSWSGGGSGGAASPSATADEETSRHQTSAVRSKVCPSLYLLLPSCLYLLLFSSSDLIFWSVTL